MFRRLVAPILAGLLMALPAAAAEIELLMVVQPGCVYCAQWDRENGDKYALTDEGKAAPLRRIQLRDPLPAGVTFQRPATFTPTFVLTADGAEVGRIEGYPGEDFFWPMLRLLITRAGAG